MPAIASITLTDDAAGNSVTFTPFKGDPKQSVLIKRNTTDSRLDMTITSGLNSATANRPTNKPILSFAMPVETSTYASDGISVIDTARFKIEEVIPDTFSEAQRQLFEEYTQNLISQTVIRGVTRTLDPMY